MKSSTASDTVTRLLICDGLRDMMTMGTIRKQPPVRATRNRASLSTCPETSLGRLLSLYSLLRSAFSCSEKVNHTGGYCIRT